MTYHIPPTVQPTLRIRTPDIPKSCATSPDKWRLDDVAAIDITQKFKNEGDRKRSIVVQIGKFDPKKLLRDLHFSMWQANWKKKTIDPEVQSIYHRVQAR